MAKRKCGVCGECCDQNEMIRNEGSSTGYICIDCYYEDHPEYEIDEW